MAAPAEIFGTVRALRVEVVAGYDEAQGRPHLAEYAIKVGPSLVNKVPFAVRDFGFFPSQTPVRKLPDHLSQTTSVPIFVLTVF